MMAVPLIFGKYLSDKKKLFWLFHSLFWLANWAIPFFTNPHITSSLNIIIQHTCDVMIGFTLCLGLRYIYKKTNWYKYSLNTLVPLVIISSAACGILWEYIQHLTNFMAGGMPYFEKLSSIRYLLYRIWFLSYPFIAWSGLYFGYKFWEEWHEQRVRFEQEQAFSHQAQLAMLRYQVNPHFLFNTFSSLRALVHIDADKADEMITKMSEFLRYSLLEGDNNEVPFSREIEIIKVYLEIESIRFKENLIVEFKIDQKAEHYPIPVFLIHPLIENAIKYGMKTSPMPLNIFVKANVVDDYLQIEVKNTGRWIGTQAPSETIKKGIGLDNVRKRLEHSYPNNHAMEIIKNGGSVSVRLRLRKGS